VTAGELPPVAVHKGTAGARREPVAPGAAADGSGSCRNPDGKVIELPVPAATAFYVGGRLFLRRQCRYGRGQAV
jgi:hypothetical protein